MQQALLPGDCELQQLLHTFQLLGTPNEEIWPGAALFPCLRNVHPDTGTEAVHLGFLQTDTSP